MRIVDVMVDRPCCLITLFYTLLLMVTIVAIGLEFLEFSDITDMRAGLIRDDPIVMDRDRLTLMDAEYDDSIIEYGEENP